MKPEFLEKYRDAVVLGIDTSCDETACANVRGGRTVLSDIVNSQVEFHAAYGGVVPEIASRRHVESIVPVVEMALRKAEMSLAAVDAVAVTAGPGLVGALLVGVTAAKAIAFTAGKPLLAVHHIAGHISANYLMGDAYAPPFLCLVVSGGHSHLIKVADHGAYELIGKTRDDAAGEAFDKVARALGLGYPGGPAVERAAKGGDPDAVRFPRTYFGEGSLDFSFSGIKTAVANHLNQLAMKGGTPNVPDIAASFQKAVVEVLVENTIGAARRTGIRQVALAGGVAANGALRETLAARCAREGVGFHCPPPSLCTDNAAMIASAGYFDLIDGRLAGLDLNADPSLGLFSEKSKP